MKNLLALTLLFVCFLGFSQNGEIKIRHIANAGLYMTDGDLNVYFDFPYKPGAFGYTIYDESELDSIKKNSLFLFTHKHGDHYSRKLLKPHRSEVYGPWKFSKKDGNGGEIINDPEHNFFVKAYKNKHRFSLSHCSYLITWHGKTIFVSGDAESPETIAKMENMDWAFVPEWLLYYAKLGNVNIDANRIGIYHLYPNDTVEDDYGNNVVNLRDHQEKITLKF
ncbi:MBL fold metallo-hydrolase [Owenweeksia hongkongensis]|uniref:MBL fold metallo-hydrolase n=1 Tax=Owenweeksia hongkongensis TaxID=253245 RepID=UPI003A8E42F2